MKRCFCLLVAAIALRAQAPTDAEIRTILADRIDTLHQNVGIAVGIVDANGRRFVSCGNFSIKDARRVGSGVYQLAPGITLTFTREGGQMFTQLTGQPKFEIFAEGEKDFFLKVVNAQITFETGEDGRATAATLHQNGRDQKAKRVEH